MKNETIQIKQRTSSYGQINAEVIGDWEKINLNKNAIIKESESGSEVIGLFTYYIDIKCDSELNAIFEGHGTSDVKHLRSLKMAEYSTRTEFLNPEKVVRLACDLKVTFVVKNQPVSEVKSDMQETLCDFGIQQWAKTTLQQRLEFIVKDFREKAIEYYTNRFGLVEDEWLQASGDDAILNGLYEQQKQLELAHKEAMEKNRNLLMIRIRQMLEASYNEF